MKLLCEIFKFKKFSSKFDKTKINFLLQIEESQRKHRLQSIPDEETTGTSRL